MDDKQIEKYLSNIAPEEYGYNLERIKREKHKVQMQRTGISLLSLMLLSFGLFWYTEMGSQKNITGPWFQQEELALTYLQSVEENYSVNYLYAESLSQVDALSNYASESEFDWQPLYSDWDM